MRDRVGGSGILAGAVGLVACSSGSLGSSTTPPPSGRVAGSDPGVSFDAEDAASWSETATLQGEVSTALRVQVADKRGVCAIVEPSSGSLSGGRLIRITVGYRGATVPAGTYELVQIAPVGMLQVQTYNVVVELETTDQQCVSNSAAATSGTLTLEAVTSTAVSGTFDVVFPGAATAAGDHVSGRFVAPICGRSAPIDGGTPACN